MIKVTEYSALSTLIIDSNECSNENDYIRLPDAEFSAYSAIWVNSNSMTIVSYVEGDITRTYCETAKEFTEELERYSSVNDFPEEVWPDEVEVSDDGVRFHTPFGWSEC